MLGFRIKPDAALSNARWGNKGHSVLFIDVDGRRVATFGQIEDSELLSLWNRVMHSELKDSIAAYDEDKERIVTEGGQYPSESKAVLRARTIEKECQDTIDAVVSTAARNSLSSWVLHIMAYGDDSVEASKAKEGIVALSEWEAQMYACKDKAIADEVTGAVEWPVAPESLVAILKEALQG